MKLRKYHRHRQWRSVPGDYRGLAIGKEKGGELFGNLQCKIRPFPPLEKGDEGGFYGFSKD